ncbi:hypothetical protein Y032_0002g623 [Ancylostoma ceylanicum]|uniref:G-protein coupled receptors family 1 profile domain-containing protein n=1 Tax=Ancylostoma ceylanicum TaxID=53326 RepID=A0A016W2E0_9BILA|nr:hypothetical protein Y032_0002g623 [Ancylostoma ceylanicum]
MGWFSTVLFANVIQPTLFPNLDHNTIDFIAGIFVNLALSCNFFVYYIVSKEYRKVFNELLHLDHKRSRTIEQPPKAAWKLAGRTPAQVCSTSSDNKLVLSS